MAAPRHKWTAELVEALKAEIAGGASYGKIALLPAFEGFSRNALIGKAQRSGFATRDPVQSGVHAALKVKIATDRADARKRAKAAITINARPATPDEKAIAAERAAEEMAAIEPVVSEGEVGIDALKERHCRMPLWPTGSWPTKDQTLFCGKRTVIGRSWCRDCMKRVFTISPKAIPPGRQRMEAW